jgi:hypothetical protein
MLTLAGEGHDPTITTALVDSLAFPDTVTVRLSTPVPRSAEVAIREVSRWYTECGTRQFNAHFLVDSLLINMVAEATGRSWADVVQAVAAGLIE